MGTETLVSTIFQLYLCFQFHQCGGPSNVTDKLLSQNGNKSEDEHRYKIHKSKKIIIQYTTEPDHIFTI